MVVTAGDHFAELIAAENLGIVVEASNVEQLADALERALFDEKFIAKAKANIHRVRELYYWETALAPLVDFVAGARHSGDHRGLTAGELARVSQLRRRRRRSGLRHDLGRALFYLRNGGVSTVLNKVKNRLKRR